MKRLKFIDLAKALAAVFMVCVHILNTHTLSAIEKDTYFGKIITLLGESPAAPVFMFSMGLSFSYSRNFDFMSRLKRSGSIFLKGYKLNFFRLLIPAIFFGIVSLFVKTETVEEISKEGDVIQNILNNFLVIDILQFAGLSYLVMTLLSRYKIPVKYIAILILLIGSCSTYVWGIQTGYPFIDRILDLFWGDKGDAVSFPLFPWLVYPLTGYVMGYYFLHKEDKEVLMKSFYLGTFLFLIGGIITYRSPVYHLGDYWHTRIGGIMLYIGFVLIWMKICDILIKYVSEKSYKPIAFLSKNLTNFYAIQWIIIVGLIPFLGQKECNVYESILLMILVFFVTYWITMIMERKKINF
ncbi:hypothetical protein AX766_02070 [Flavobacterium covae]|uniref:Acyltransferase n=1 Tax=Flavobacterium covae TaxID=2906076 RepID=A0ABW8PEU7_9FLAO|nr:MULTISPECIES: acyltransferase [Flavobacterium]OXA83282.1 hypothetical protein B0A56_01930 [Flavobacterium columnare NBRC 100251 = ATCC 23463]AND63295.1 hypothetical protein AX766_02070 [Flavobacterium covae]MCJ1806036.1 acyltransferase [Flavobacterium covae]OWP82544.1 hypothetical protein BWK63_00565 [Flavobacterium covae]POR21461.1 hypothetical protein BWK57_09890 [Flavobacterium columnare]